MGFPVYLCIATEEMIKGVTVNQGKNFIQLQWLPPQYNPMEYAVSAGCLECDGKLEVYERVLPPITGKNPSDDKPVTAVVIDNLRPGSKCEIHFRAVYNPASLDSGMYINTSTLKAGIFIVDGEETIC